jgi:hypothetical protein
MCKKAGGRRQEAEGFNEPRRHEEHEEEAGK